MTQTNDLLKTRHLDFLWLAWLYSTHPCGSAATFLSPCKLWSFFCFVSSISAKIAVIVHSEFVFARNALKTWHLDFLKLARLYSTHPSSSAATSLSPYKPLDFSCLVSVVTVDFTITSISVFAHNSSTQKTWCLNFLTLAWLYSTHPCSSAAASLSPYKLWIFLCCLFPAAGTFCLDLVFTDIVALLSFTGAFLQTSSTNYNEAWHLDFLNMLSGLYNPLISAIAAVPLSLVSMFLNFSCRVCAVAVLFVL